MEAITLTINGQTISARPDRTILEVAKKHGIGIPTLCHHEFLRPIGACRVCQVEDLGRKVVVPACVTKVAPGMEIATESERVVRNRRNIVRLIMAAHPESCVVCEKGNSCELRALAAKLGVGEHGLDDMPYHPGVQDLNPFLARDLSKCIMCAKCLRADQEVVVEGVIDYHKRGFDAHPATLFGSSLADGGCTFCGTCLSVCPTGALFEKNKTSIDHAGARTATVCSFCACGCSIYLEHNHNYVSGVIPTAGKATANGISCCVKGHFGHDYLNHPDRLTTPLIKGEDGFRPATWEEALSAVAQGLGKAAGRAGGKALGFLAGAGLTNEESYLFGRLARASFASPNLGSVNGDLAGPVLKAFKQATGWSASSATFADIEAAQVIFLAGADPTQTAPVAGYHVKRALKKGAKLITCDSMAGKLAPQAAHWLQPAPGGDRDLLAGLVAHILADGLVDHKFVGSKTTGLEELTASFSGAKAADLCRAAKVDPNQAREAAALLGTAESVVFLVGEGFMRQAGAGELASLLAALALVTGNLGRQGSGLMILHAEANTQGCLDMGLAPDLLPGQADIGDKAARSRLKNLWGKPVPAGPGLGAAEMLAAAGDGKLAGMFIMGEDPLSALPGGEANAAALSGLKFLVAADLFMSPTAALANVVLPLSALAEKDGSITNLERRVQRVTRAVPAPGDFPAEVQWLGRLAGLVGQKGPALSAAEVWAEMEEAAPIYQGVTPGGTDKSAFWPAPGNLEIIDTLPHGIGFADGKAKIPAPGPQGGATPAKAKGFPMILAWGHQLCHLGDGGKSGHSKRLTQAAPAGYLAMSRQDMAKRKLTPGQTVKVSSPHGSVEAAVAEDGRLPSGLVFMPVGHPGPRPGALFPPGAESRFVAVALRKT